MCTAIRPPAAVVKRPRLSSSAAQGMWLFFRFPSSVLSMAESLGISSETRSHLSLLTNGSFMSLNHPSNLQASEFQLSSGQLGQRFLQARGLWLTALCVAVMAASGCQEQRYPTVKYPTTWAELQQMQSAEIAMPVDTSYAQGDMASFKKAILSPEFAAALDQFDASEIPSSFNDEARKKSKDEAVAQYRKCIELLKSNGPQDEVKAAYEAASAAFRSVSAPLE